VQGHASGYLRRSGHWGSTHPYPTAATVHRWLDACVHAIVCVSQSVSKKKRCACGGGGGIEVKSFQGAGTTRWLGRRSTERARGSDWLIGGTDGRAMPCMKRSDLPWKEGLDSTTLLATSSSVALPTFVPGPRSMSSSDRSHTYVGLLTISKRPPHVVRVPSAETLLKQGQANDLLMTPS
jgi:hypothetical protein